MAGVSGVWRDNVSFRFPTTVAHLPVTKSVRGRGQRAGLLLKAAGRQPYFLNSVFTRIVNDCVIGVGNSGGALACGDPRAQPQMPTMAPTINVDYELPLGKKTSPVQYVRAIRPGVSRAGARVGIRFR